MNLRILKKLSKRAAPLLAALGDQRAQFPAERWESYTVIVGHDRKHWERTASIHAEPILRGHVNYLPKHGKRYVSMREPHHPLKGTIMVGEMVGYYEPEWEEETAWESLCNIVRNHFTDWTPEVGSVWLGPRLDTPTRMLKAARDIIAGVSAIPTRPQSHADRLEAAGVITLMKDGRILVECSQCGRDDELPVDISEIDEAYRHYCGGSPRCCP